MPTRIVSGVDLPAGLSIAKRPSLETTEMVAAWLAGVAAESVAAESVAADSVVAESVAAESVAAEHDAAEHGAAASVAPERIAAEGLAGAPLRPGVQEPTHEASSAVAEAAERGAWHPPGVPHGRDHMRDQVRDPAQRERAYERKASSVGLAPIDLPAFLRVLPKAGAAVAVAAGREPVMAEALRRLPPERPTPGLDGSLEADRPKARRAPVPRVTIGAAPDAAATLVPATVVPATVVPADWSAVPVPALTTPKTTPPGPAVSVSTTASAVSTRRVSDLAGPQVRLPSFLVEGARRSDPDQRPAAVQDAGAKNAAPRGSEPSPPPSSAADRPSPMQAIPLQQSAALSLPPGSWAAAPASPRERSPQGAETAVGATVLAAPTRYSTESAAVSPSDARADTVIVMDAPVGSDVWQEQLGAQLSVMAMAGGEAEAVMKLAPEGMGEIEVRVVVRQGEASLQFGAADARAREALEVAQPRLRELFTSQGLDVASFSVFSSLSGDPRSASRAFSRPERASRVTLEAAVDLPLQAGERVSQGIVDTYA